MTFSKLRPIFRQGRVSSIQAFLQPPYGKRAKNVLDWMFSLRG
jgi:coniferyl-aldehyde dehydrogenase